jgi:L-ascorbate metabolism protein UlaG (beta-lactamase superfamily)
MKTVLVLSILFAVVPMSAALAGEGFDTDIIETSGGDLSITFVGHGSLVFQFGGRVVHVDPFSRAGDYASLPKADIVLVTHEHPDHLDPKALEQIHKKGVEIVANGAAAAQIEGARVLKNGEESMVKDLRIEAVPAYNLVHQRDSGEPFHPKGNGNGYVITFGNKKVYVAGDTENIPEMKELKGIDIAFLPMNLPYTMTPAMVADAARMFMPKILYPYHYGKTDTSELVNLLKESKEIEVRIRRMP